MRIVACNPDVTIRANARLCSSQSAINLNEGFPLMADENAKITVYGAPWCPDFRRSKKFLAEQLVRYHCVDIDENAEGRVLVEAKINGKRIIPTIVFDNASFMVEPTNAELAHKLGLQTRSKLPVYDL